MGKTSLWCRAENRTRACLTASRGAINWATPHHKLLASRIYHKTNRVSHTAPENDRCKSSLYIYLTTKCIQHWAPFRLSIWAENRTRADLTSFSTSDSKRYEARTQRWHDTDLKARYWSLTLSGCWKTEKSRSQHGSLTTAYTSLVGVSDMHMNLK